MILTLEIVKLTMSGFIITLIYFFFPPQFKGAVYSEKDGKRCYNLVRLPEQGIIAGVCSGIAYKFGINPWLPRLFFIVLATRGFMGIGIYLLIWYFADSARTPSDYPERMQRRLR
jgi:phage shock protein PspC (stress-responsive transcriptional regulator)